MSDSCTNNCNDHGTCLDNKCSCDLGFFTDDDHPDCLLSGKDEWGKAWTFFLAFYISIFVCTFLTSFFKLYKSLNREETFDCVNKCKRVVLSPKNLSLLGICFISFIKVIWLSYDPLIFKGRSNRLIDRLLFETIYPLIFTVLASVLLVWASLYQSISFKAQKTFKYTKKLIVFLMIIVYPFTWVLSINKGIRAEKTTWYWVGYISLAIGACLLSFLFILFSILLFKYLNQDKKNSEIGFELDIKEDKLDIKNTINLNEESSDYIINEAPPILRYRKTAADFWKQEKTPKFFLELTKDDKTLITKILVLTTISGISGLIVIAIGTPFTIGDALNDPKLTLFGIFIGFILETLICWLVIFTFTRQISNPNKKNIKHMFYLARTNRMKRSELRATGEFENIRKRLSMFYDVK